MHASSTPAMGGFARLHSFSTCESTWAHSVVDAKARATRSRFSSAESSMMEARSSEGRDSRPDREQRRLALRLRARGALALRGAAGMASLDQAFQEFLLLKRNSVGLLVPWTLRLSMVSLWTLRTRGARMCHSWRHML